MTLVLEFCNKRVIINYRYLLQIFLMVSHCCLVSLCDPMDCSMPGFPVLHPLPERAQPHDHWVSNVIHHLILCHPLLLLPLSFPASESFPISGLIPSGGQSIEASALALVLLMNTQCWFPLGLTGLISCGPRDFQESSSVQFESISSLTLSLLYGPTLTSVHDYWENHSFD